MVLYRSHNDERRLSTEHFGKFEFFMTHNDPGRYTYKHRKEYFFGGKLADVTKIKLPKHIELEDVLDITGGLPLNVSKKLILGLKEHLNESEEQYDGLFFPDNEEAIVWNYDKLHSIEN